jgi:hypothetical protein
MYLLSCSHCIGGRRKEYDMRCEVLSSTIGDKLKVRVYGRMYWKDTDHLSRVRYVDGWRVRPAPNPT